MSSATSRSCSFNRHCRKCGKRQGTRFWTTCRLRFVLAWDTEAAFQQKSQLEHQAGMQRATSITQDHASSGQGHSCRVHCCVPLLLRQASTLIMEFKQRQMQEVAPRHL